MLCRNTIPLFLVLAVCPLAIVNGALHVDFVKELRRKILIFWHGKPVVPEGPIYEGCNLCKFGPCTPIIQPSDDDKDYDGTADAKAYYDALDTDRAKPLSQPLRLTFAKVLINRSAVKRAAIAKVFENKYRMKLREAIPFRLGRWWWYYIFLAALSLPMPDFFAGQFQDEIEQLEKSNSATSKDLRDQGRRAIVEILMTLPKCLTDEIVNKYNAIKDKKDKDFFRDLNKALEIGGMPQEYREFVMRQSEQKKEANEYSWIKAFLSAHKLKSAIESQDMTTINQIVPSLFTKETDSQIIETLTIYENLRRGGKGFLSLFDDIDKYMVSVNEVYIIRVKLLMNKPLYFAKTLEAIFKNGKKADLYETRVLYLLRGRYDIDLKDIFNTYNKEDRKRFKLDFKNWGSNGINMGAFFEVIEEIMRNKEDDD